MNFFITGTDTDVGKTLVSAWLCRSTNFSYWKPLQTGNDDDSHVIRKFAEDIDIVPNACKLSEPLSPFDASRFEIQKISIKKILETKLPNNTVIEGAGGILVPITQDFYMADLAKAFNSKVIIVAKSKLGFLNHIFLTVNLLKSMNIEIIGIIINGLTEKFLIDTIENLTNITVLFEFDTIENLMSTKLPKKIERIMQ